jgi:iron-sulfur cluster assembly accessory protein
MPEQFRFPIGANLIYPHLLMITITSRASAELAALLLAKSSSLECGLRLAVRRGGCAGWQYEMNVAKPEPGDIVVESADARVIVAADSLDRLKGCEIDFSDELTDAGFKVRNPNASRSCGCGTSFEAVNETPGLHAVPDGEACGGG